MSDEKICEGELSGLKLAVNVPAAGTATLFTCSTDGVVREFDYRNLSKISLISVMLANPSQRRRCTSTRCARL